MRPIKFRVWDGEEMHQPGYVHRIEFAEDGGVIAWVWETNYITAPREGATLLQFTGLYDADGKEIYEGDVLEVADETTEDERVSCRIGVQFERGSFRSRSGNSLGDIGPNLYRVIGNIYEHPSLLETAQ